MSIKWERNCYRLIIVIVVLGVIFLTAVVFLYEDWSTIITGVKCGCILGVISSVCSFGIIRRETVYDRETGQVVHQREINEGVESFNAISSALTKNISIVFLGFLGMFGFTLLMVILFLGLVRITQFGYFGHFFAYLGIIVLVGVIGHVGRRV
jgi:hypothetical protein